MAGKTLVSLLMLSSGVCGLGNKTNMLPEATENDFTVTPSGKIVVDLTKVRVPDSAEPHWPYNSVEEYFTFHGLTEADLEATDIQHCSTAYPGGKVYTITDGVNTRCFVAIIPTSIKDAAPVLYMQHGSGGSAWKCGEASDLNGRKWIDVAVEYGFIFICGEAVQSTTVNEYTGQLLGGGMWSMPEIFNETSGPNCDLSIDEPGGIELAYFSNMMTTLEKEPSVFNLTKFFIHGCSQGSAMTIWQGVCHHIEDADKYPAIATHSTGLKTKGDGNILPPCLYDPPYTWGECPECEYWPTVMSSVTSGLKACIFDNTADSQSNNPQFYRTSQALEAAWKAKGYKSETYFGSGGHCVMHSFEDIAVCLDDGTGDLLKDAPACEDIAPDSTYSCADQYALGKCSKAWMVGYCCKTCFDCDTGCGA